MYIIKGLVFGTLKGSNICVQDLGHCSKANIITKF